MVRKIVIFAASKKSALKEELEQREDKVDAIIAAAQKRFAVFGAEKTSMREIADDLHMSKASLYYYFPDKESLYLAVLEKEQAEFIHEMSEIIRNISEPDRMLKEYAVRRLGYFSRLLNLSRLRLEAYSDLKPALRDTTRSFKEKETELVKEIFKAGIDKGIFAIEDISQTAILFLDLLKGLRASLISGRKMLVIDQSEFNTLLEKTRTFTDIFIKGISPDA